MASHRTHSVGDVASSSSSVVAATPCVVTSNALIFWADFFSSWSAYVVALCLAHPIDTLRVRRQSSIAPQAASALAIVRADGVRSLYAGFGTPVFSNAPLVASVFALNECFRTFYRWVNVEVLHNEGLRTAAYYTHAELFIAGSSAGVVSSLVACPATLVKVQQQTRAVAAAATATAAASAAAATSTTSNTTTTTRRRALPAPSVYSVVSQVYVNHGAAGLFRGLSLEAGCSAIGRGVYFTGYEVFKSQFDVLFRYLRIAPATAAPADSSSTSNFIYITGRNVLAAAATSSLGWLSVYPIDVVKVRLMADGIAPGDRRYRGPAHCATELYRTLGLRGFWRGFSLTIVRSWLSSGMALPLYEVLRPKVRALVPRCPEDTSPGDTFGKPTTYIKDLFVEDTL